MRKEPSESGNCASISTVLAGSGAFAGDLMNTGATLAAESFTAPDYAALAVVDAAHYHIERDLARGGMGRIRVARDRRLGRPVALKELLVQSGDLAIRFEREARINARLQHPSIMPIYEAGAWPSGEPFYAMKLVTGRSLNEVIAEATTLDKRLALLPNVLAVADAIAYAHSERVIHRDLKPHNVLVGAFGETVVIDWGLAKELDGADDASSRDRVAPQNGFETQDGEIMGTPAYMPPEQARGEPVDERADVYAIGAILFHLLAGRPPVTGSSAAELLAKVIDGECLSLRTIEPAVPPDLLAIVDKALELDPARRYPTARELADDLRRFQTGQLVGAHQYSLNQLVRRWLRKHRTAFTVGTIAFVTLLVLGAIALQRIVAAERVAQTQRVRAEEQGTLATSNQTEVEGLLDYMMFDLHGKLSQLGRTDLLGEVATKAHAYYARQPDNAPAAVLLRRVASLQNVAAVMSTRGATDQALDTLREALRLAHRVVGTEPSAWALQTLAAAERQLVGPLYQQGKLDEAKEHMGRAVGIGALLVAQYPYHSAHRVELAADHTSLAGLLYGEQRLDDAVSHYVKAREIQEMLLREAPDDRARTQALATTLIDLGKALQQSASPRASEPFVLAVRMSEEIAKAEPSNAVLKSHLANARFEYGDQLARVDDHRGALVQLRRALPLFEELVASDPSSIQRLSAVTGVHQLIGQSLARTGQLEQAAASLGAALANAERCAGIDPANVRWKEEVARLHSRLGHLLVQRGELANARKEIDDAIASYDALVAANPTRNEYRFEQGTAQENLGDLLLAGEDFAGARRMYDAALAGTLELAERLADHPVTQDAVAGGYDKVGEAALAAGDVDAGLAARRAALAYTEKLRDKWPSRAELDVHIAVRMKALALARAQSGDAAGARQTLTATLEAARASMERLDVLRADPVLTAVVAETEKLLKTARTQRKRR